MSAGSRLGLHLRQFTGVSVPRTRQVGADVVEAPLQARKAETREAGCPSAAAPHVAAGGQPEGASDAGKAQPDLQWLLPSKPKHYTSLITACGTLTELQAVCWTYHSHLTPIQISAAFTTVVRIVTRHGQPANSSSSYAAASREAVQLVGWLLDRLSRQRASCSSREVANALWCLAKLRHHPGPVYIHTLLDHFLDVLPTSSSQGISMTLYALAQLQHAPSDAWLAQVIPALTRAAAAEAAAGAQPAQALSNSCWALGTLEVPGASHWVCDLLGCAITLAEAQQQQQQKVAAAAWSRQHVLTTQCTSSPAPSVPRQQQQEEEEGEEVQGKAPGAGAATGSSSSSTPAEGASKARAALQHLLQQAQLPQAPPAPLGPRATQGVQPQQPQEPAESASGEQAAGAVVTQEAHLVSVSPPTTTISSSSQQQKAALAPLGSQAVANMVWAAAAVVQKEWTAAQWAGPPQQQQQWQGHGAPVAAGSGGLVLVRSVARQVARLLQLSAAQGCLQQAAPSELAMLVWGAGRLNLASMPEGWWSAFLPATLQQLQTRPWSPQELATLLRGCVRCRVRPPLLWMQAFCAASAASLPAATCCEVSVMVWALGKWGYAPPASWVAQALQVVGRQLPMASSNHLGMLLFGLSRLRYRPQEELVRGLLQRLYDTIPATRDPHILSATLYALQRMQLTPGRDLLRRLVDASCQLLGTIRSEDLVLLLGSLAELQPAPRVSPGQLWVSLEKERALVQHRIELLRQRMAALAAEEEGAAGEQLQQQGGAGPQAQEQEQEQRSGSHASSHGLVAGGGPLATPAAYTTALSATRGGGRGEERQEALWQLEGQQQPGGWLMAGLDDMPPPPVLMQSYLEVMEEEEEEEEEVVGHSQQQQQGQQQGQQVGLDGIPSAPAAAVAVSWRWLEDTLATEHVAIAAAKAAAAAEAGGSASQHATDQPPLPHQQQQPSGHGPRRLQNEAWRTQQVQQVHQQQQQSAASSSSLVGGVDALPLAGFQKAGEEAEEQLLHAARLLQAAAASERLTEQQYIRVRQKLVVQQRRLSRLYSQQQVELSQGHLLLTTAQVGCLFSRAEELLPGMAPDDLIAVLRAAAWLGADVSAAPWRAALRRTLLPAVKSCSAPQLVALLWSLVQLQGYLQPSQRLLMAAVARCEELLAVGQTPSQKAPGTGQTLTGTLQPCSCMQLTQMVWALARLGCVRYIGPRWARTYVAAFSRQLQHMGGREVGVVLRTMVRLRMAAYVPPALLERVELLMEVKSAVWPSSSLGLVAAAVVKLQQQQLLMRKLAARQQAAAQQAAAAGAQTKRSSVSQGAIRRMSARTRRASGSSSSSGSSSPLRRGSSMEQLQAAAARERQLLHVSVAEVLQALADQGVTTRAGRMAALVQDSRAALEVTVQQQEAAAAAGAGAAGGLGAGPSVLGVAGAAGGQGVGASPPPTLVSQELAGVSTLTGGPSQPGGEDMQVVYLAV